MLKSGECLLTNQYLHSYDAGFYAIMQSDGNFVIYKDTCPEDNRGFLWNTGATGGGGRFFAVMQEDGNFCIYHGDPGSAGALLWDIRRTAPGKQFIAALMPDGVFAIFNGEVAGFGLPATEVWDTQTKGRPGYKLILDQNTGDAKDATHSTGMRTFWQSFTMGGTSNIARIDLGAGYAKAGFRSENQVRLREGVGTKGRSGAPRISSRITSTVTRGRIFRGYRSFSKRKSAW